MNVKTAHDIVFRALDNALENGFDFREAQPSTVAMDLGTYDADVEHIKPGTVLQLVRDWQHERSKRFAPAVPAQGRPATNRDTLVWLLDAYREYRDAVKAERAAYGDAPAEMQHAAARVEAAEQGIAEATAGLAEVAGGEVRRFPAMVRETAERRLRPGTPPPNTFTDITIRINGCPDLQWAELGYVLEVVIPTPRPT
jgi:hypothetical protein